MEILDLGLVALGIALLYLGGEWLVRGAASLGARLGWSPIVIGLTIVSVGTSSPELAASLTAAFVEAPAMSFGNVVGSNIANLSLVLGLTALIWPLHVAARFLSREMPFMLATSLMMFLLVANGVVGRIEGFLLVALLVFYLFRLLKGDETPEVEAEFSDAFGSRRKPLWLSLAAVLAGIVLLVLGARALISGAVGTARSLGISERVIGLTMVALGTSLPELASSVVAAIRHQSDIVLGNLIGSNIFNVLFILGTTAVAHPIPVDLYTSLPDLLAMVAVSLLAWRLLHTGSVLGRLEGTLLTAAYTAYVVFLFVA